MQLILTVTMVILSALLTHLRITRMRSVGVHGTHVFTSTSNDLRFGVLPKNPPTLRSNDPTLPQPVGQPTYRSVHAQYQTGHFTGDAATTTHQRKHISVGLAALWPISLRNSVQLIVELSMMSKSSVCSPHT